MRTGQSGCRSSSLLSHIFSVQEGVTSNTLETPDMPLRVERNQSLAFDDLLPTAGTLCKGRRGFQSQSIKMSLVLIAARQSGQDGLRPRHNLRGVAADVLAPLALGELGVGLVRDGFIGGDGVAAMTGIWTHF